MENRQTYISEIELLMRELEYKKPELDKAVEETITKYPQIESKRDAVFLIAKEKNLQFQYGENGRVRDLSSVDPDLDLDISKFID